MGLLMEKSKGATREGQRFPLNMGKEPPPTGGGGANGLLNLGQASAPSVEVTSCKGRGNTNQVKRVEVLGRTPADFREVIEARRYIEQSRMTEGKWERLGEWGRRM